MENSQTSEIVFKYQQKMYSVFMGKAFHICKPEMSTLNARNKLRLTSGH